MHPQIQLPTPGKCPLCFMDLIPVKRDSASAEMEAVSLRTITITPQARKLAEVMVQPVERRAVDVETRMVGKVDYDERSLGYITAWMGGRIDKLYVDYTGSIAKKGQRMASIYSPELLTAQVELIQSVKAIRKLEKSTLRLVKETAEQTGAAARKKLRLLGLSNKQIDAVIERGTPSDHITLYAPMSGVVIQKDVVEGMYVKTGTRIYAIADLSLVWVVLEAYESDLPWIKLGQQADFQTEAYPGEVFKGKVVYIDPVVNEKTRTVRVRVNVPNRGGKLKPGMFVSAVNLAEAKGGAESLVIPASAPLITGKRAVVYVEVPGREGTYEGREIVLGPRAGGYYVVKNGLSEGDLVVTKGNFKIDSAIQIMAKPSMMNPQGGSAGGGHQHQGAHPKESGSKRSSSSFRVPAPLATKLHHLAVTLNELEGILGGRDLEKSRGAYRGFYEQLGAIDPRSLTGRPTLVWKELTMLLGNDAILGSEADTLEEAERLSRVLHEHFERLRDNFDFESTSQSVTVAADVPAKFKEQLGEVLGHYLKLQEALAGDDLTSSKAVGPELERAVKHVDMKLLDDEAHAIWMRVLGTMDPGLRAILAADDITALRSGFEPFSVGLTEAVEKLGVQTTGPIFEMYCPMAFDDKGATWLQKTEELRNPYFGAAMLKCGEVSRRLKEG
jgi:Cu(I)/Ag(I) efflux system membrane fusion protein